MIFWGCLSFLAPAAMTFHDSVTFPPYSLYTRKVGQQNVKIKSHPIYSSSSTSFAAALIHTISGIDAFMSPTKTHGDRQIRQQYYSGRSALS